MAQTAVAPKSLEGLFAGPQDLVDRLPMLRTVLQKTATTWADLIRGISATTPKVVLVGIESRPVESMAAATANQGVACVLEAPKWNARMILGADNEFVFTAVEMLLGGDGSEPAPNTDR